MASSRQPAACSHSPRPFCIHGSPITNHESPTTHHRSRFAIHLARLAATQQGSAPMSPQTTSNQHPAVRSHPLPVWLRAASCQPRAICLFVTKNAFRDKIPHDKTQSPSDHRSRITDHEVSSQPTPNRVSPIPPSTIRNLQPPARHPGVF
jgi:hypothetical protein